MDLSDYIAPAGAEQEGKFWSGFLPALGGDVSDMARSLLDYVKTPGQVLKGEKGPEAGRDFAAQTAMLGYGVGPKVPGAAGMFGGELAKTANKAKLSEAKELAANGASRDEIWNKTGWFQGVDSKWRFEIPDAAAGVTDRVDRNQFNPELIRPPDPEWKGGKSIPIKLQDLISHPEALAAYPEALGNIDVKGMPLSNIMSTKGALTEDASTIYLGGAKLQDFLSTALHEMQHAVQKHEGFARGGSPQPIYPPELADRVKDIKTEFNNAKDLVRGHTNPYTLQGALETQASGGDLWSHEKAALKAAEENGTLELFQRAWARHKPIADAERNAFERYHNLAGEVEARNVQERFKGGPIPIQTPQGPRLLQGDNPAPWYTKDEGGTMDVPAKDQIVVRQEDVSGRHSIRPVEHDPFAGADLSISGYHGTPHTFQPKEGEPLGSFDNKAIGSGEGAQAYGWGHYVAGNKKVAEGYKDSLSGTKIYSRGTNQDFHEELAASAIRKRLEMESPSPKHEIDMGQPHIGPAGTILHDARNPYTGNTVFFTTDPVTGKTSVLGHAQAGYEESLPSLAEAKQRAEQNLHERAVYYDAKYAIDKLKGGKPLKEPSEAANRIASEMFEVKHNPGNLYHVEIKPDEHELLDWDSHVENQPHVIKALQKLQGDDVHPSNIVSRLQAHANSYNYSLPNNSSKTWKDITGQNVYDYLTILGKGDPALASEALHNAGIPGIRYKDAGSRGKEGGTHNYVIFHPDNLKITGRNGEMLTLKPVENDPFSGAQP